MAMIYQIYLAIGTAVSILFLIFLFKGSKYDYLIEPLEGDDFPFKTIYSAGLALQDINAAQLQGKIGDDLRKNTKLYYTAQFGEYYARIAWAQALSFGMLCFALMFVLAGVFKSTLFAVLAVVLSIAAGYYFVTFTQGKVKSREEACDKEFPNAIVKLALMVNSGVILRDAWMKVARGKEGEFYDLMRISCDEMENGKSEIDAIRDFGTKTDSDDIKKFTSALIQSIERGGGDLPVFLANQSGELWELKRQKLLQKGEKAAGELLMPIALMFLGVMLIVISAAMQSFSL